MRPSQTEQRVGSYDYRQWKEYRKAEAKAHQWDAGHWGIPYQQQAEAMEQAFRLVELCQESFQRAARQLANVRLVRAKAARAGEAYKWREGGVTTRCYRGIGLNALLGAGIADS